ncbi:MAG: hypothetical protein EBR30_02370 [Cytophagia bacterium]|jgi:hypothetical protein|nr:hypothetical protein [Cytophagia bacterium]
MSAPIKDKVYYVLNDDTVQYIIEAPAEEDIYILKRSSSEYWTPRVRGEEVLTVLNSGNGYKIQWKESTGKVLDYAQAIELTIILNFLNQKCCNIPMKYSIVSAENVTELL